MLNDNKICGDSFMVKHFPFLDGIFFFRWKWNWNWKLHKKPAKQTLRTDLSFSGTTSGFPSQVLTRGIFQGMVYAAFFWRRMSFWYSGFLFLEAETPGKKMLMFVVWIHFWLIGCQLVEVSWGAKLCLKQLSFAKGCVNKESLEVNHYFKNGGFFWKMINPY